MARIRHSSEQIIGKLREAEVLLGQGQLVADVCKRLEVTEQTYYRWRKEYGGIKTEQAKRLKKLVAELSLDKRMLQEIAEGRLQQRYALKL